MIALEDHMSGGATRRFDRARTTADDRPPYGRWRTWMAGFPSSCFLMNRITRLGWVVGHAGTFLVPSRQ